ncbi:MAG: ATP-binding SpoIIE family protein phosphatase, partial [Vulcanimicrobiaceae bacterium]
GRIVFNAAAEAEFSRDASSRERCIKGLSDARLARAAKERPIGSRSMVFFPLFGDEDEITAVAAVTGTLEDVPRYMHLLKKEMPYFSQILHQTPSVVLTARPNGEIDYLSRRWYEIVPAGAALQRPREALQKAIPPQHYRAFADAWNAGIAAGEEFVVQTKIDTAQGTRTFELSARPVPRNRGGILKWVATLADVEETVAASETLWRLKNRFQILAETGNVVAAARTLDALADGLTDLASTQPGERWFTELRYPATGVAISRSITDHERPLIGAMLHTGKFTTVAGSLRYVAAPVFDGEHSLGFIGFACESGEEPSEEEIALVVEIANRAAIGVERILSFLRERELSRMLQRSMLPLALPYAPGVRLDVAYEPAQREALVGGDWYDAFELGDGTIAVAIGDVAGHGFDSAVVMNQVRHVMQAATIGSPDPSEVLSAANRLVNALGQRMVTAFFGILDPLTLAFTCASAGHPPPVIVREDGNVSLLQCEGIPLGVADDLLLKNVSGELPAGGALVLYTDGVVEDQRDLPAGELALAEALTRWARRGFTARAADLQTTLRVGSHQDDAAMFVLRFPHVDEFSVRLLATPYNAQRMRLAARRFVSGSPFEPDREFNAVLAVGEAVNNAVEHAYGDGGGMVSLTLKRESERIIVDVRDDGVWREPSIDDRMHGLGIIERLADKLDIHHGEHGTSVHIEIGYRTPRAVTLAETSRTPLSSRA